jgi:hypothetical protein
MKWEVSYKKPTLQTVVVVQNQLLLRIQNRKRIKTEFTLILWAEARVNNIQELSQMRLGFLDPRGTLFPSWPTKKEQEFVPYACGLLLHARISEDALHLSATVSLDAKTPSVFILNQQGIKNLFFLYW